MKIFQRLFSFKRDKLTLFSMIFFIAATVLYCFGLFYFFQGAAALGNEERRSFVVVVMWLAPFCGVVLSFGNLVALTNCFQGGLYIMTALNFTFALIFVPLIVGIIEQYQGTEYYLCNNMNDISDPVLRGQCRNLVWGFSIYIIASILCFLLQTTLGIATCRIARQIQREIAQSQDVKKLFDEEDISFEEKQGENKE